MKEVNHNEKNIKTTIVAANNHYGGYGPGTVDIFRHNMDMKRLSFENINIGQINHQLESENRVILEPETKSKQTSI